LTILKERNGRTCIQHHILLTPLYSEQLNNVYNFWGKIPIVCVTISHCGYWIWININLQLCFLCIHIYMVVE